MDQRVKLEWQAGYSVGNAVLDRQHQKLLTLCRRAVASLGAAPISANAELHDILNELAAYVAEHFRVEEALLRRHGFPQMAEHEAEHLAYRARLTEILYDATLGRADNEQLASYLTEWWIEHILQSDMLYATYLKSGPPPGRAK